MNIAIIRKKDGIVSAIVGGAANRAKTGLGFQRIASHDGCTVIDLIKIKPGNSDATNTVLAVEILSENNEHFGKVLGDLIYRFIKLALNLVLGQQNQFDPNNTSRLIDFSFLSQSPVASLK